MFVFPVRGRPTGTGELPAAGNPPLTLGPLRQRAPAPCSRREAPESLIESEHCADPGQPSTGLRNLGVRTFESARLECIVARSVSRGADYRHRKVPKGTDGQSTRGGPDPPVVEDQ